jgi:hypothetical protein
MTVTGSWFDIDYFNFAKGKDAADPDNATIGLRGAGLRMPTEAENYSVFDVNGVLVGNFAAVTSADVKNMTQKVVRQGGVYFVKSLKGGKAYRISVIK